jgi:hypothetical protein
MDLGKELEETHIKSSCGIDGGKDEKQSTENDPQIKFCFPYPQHI